MWVRGETAVRSTALPAGLKPTPSSLLKSSRPRAALELRICILVFVKKWVLLFRYCLFIHSPKQWFISPFDININDKIYLSGWLQRRDHSKNSSNQLCSSKAWGVSFIELLSDICNMLESKLHTKTDCNMFSAIEFIYDLIFVLNRKKWNDKNCLIILSIWYS